MGALETYSSRPHSGDRSNLNGSNSQRRRSRGGLPLGTKPGRRSESPENKGNDKDNGSEGSWLATATRAVTEVDPRNTQETCETRMLHPARAFPPKHRRVEAIETTLGAAKGESAALECEKQGLSAPVRRAVLWLRRHAKNAAFYLAIFAFSFILLSGLSPYYHGNHTRNLVRASGRFPRVPLEKNSHYALLFVKLTADDPAPDFSRPFNLPRRNRPQKMVESSKNDERTQEDEDEADVEYYPMLVVPGHRGDWRQVLPLGKTLHDIALKRNNPPASVGNEIDPDEAMEHHIFGTGYGENQQGDGLESRTTNNQNGRKVKVVYHLYVVDFHREPSAFHPTILDKQADFVIQCLEKLQSLYVPARDRGASSNLGPPLTLVGHSLGGTVVLRVLSKRRRLRSSSEVSALRDLSISPALEAEGVDAHPLEGSAKASLCEPDLSSFSFLTTVLLSSPVGGHPAIQLALPYRFFYRRLWHDFGEQFGIPVSKAALARAKEAEAGGTENHALVERAEAKPCLPSTTFLYSVASGWIDEFVVPPAALPPLFRFRFSWRARGLPKVDAASQPGHTLHSQLHFFPLLLPFSRDVHTRHTHDNLMWSRPPLLLLSQIFREQERLMGTLRDAEQRVPEARLAQRAASLERTILGKSRGDAKANGAKALATTPNSGGSASTAAAVGSRLAEAWVPLVRRMVQRVDTLTVSPFATFLSPWAPLSSLASLNLSSTAADTPRPWEAGLSTGAVPVSRELESRLQNLLDTVFAKTRRCGSSVLPNQVDSGRGESSGGDASCGVQSGGSAEAETGLYKIVSSLSELTSQPLVSPPPVVLYPLVAGTEEPLGGASADAGNDHKPSSAAETTTGSVPSNQSTSAFQRSLFFGLKPSPLAPFQRSSEGDDYNEASLPLCRRQVTLEKGDGGFSGAEKLDEVVASDVSRFLDRLLSRLKADDSSLCSSTGSCATPSKASAPSAMESGRPGAVNTDDSSSSVVFSAESAFPFAFFVANRRTPTSSAPGEARFSFRFLPPSFSLFYPTRACGWLLPPTAAPGGTRDSTRAPTEDKLSRGDDFPVLILLNMNAPFPASRPQVASEVSARAEAETGAGENGVTHRQSPGTGVVGASSARPSGAPPSSSPVPSSVSAPFSSGGAPTFQLSFSFLPFSFTRFLSYFPSLQFLLSLFAPMSVRVPLATLTASSTPSLLSAPSYLLLPSPASLAFFFPYQYTTRVEFVKQRSVSRPAASLADRMPRLFRSLCRQLDLVLVAWEQPEVAAAALSGWPERGDTSVLDLLYRGSGAQQQKFSMKKRCFLRKASNSLAGRWWPSLSVEAVSGPERTEGADGAEPGRSVVEQWTAIFQRWAKKVQFLDAESSLHIFAPRYMPPNATACTSEAQRREWREEDESPRTFSGTSNMGATPREECRQKRKGDTDDAKFIREQTTPVLLLPTVHVDDTSFMEEMEEGVTGWSAAAVRDASVSTAADGESDEWSAELVVEATGSMLSFVRLLLNMYTSVFVAFLVVISCLLLGCFLLTPLALQAGTASKTDRGLHPANVANSGGHTTAACSGLQTDHIDKYLAAARERNKSIFRTSVRFRLVLSCGLVAILSVVILSYSHAFFADFCQLHPQTDAEAFVDLSPSLVSSFLVPPSSYLFSMQAPLPPVSLLFVLLGLAGVAFWLMFHVGRAICRIVRFAFVGLAHVTTCLVSRSARARTAESGGETSFVQSVIAKVDRMVEGNGSSAGEDRAVTRKHRHKEAFEEASRESGVGSEQGSENRRAAACDTSGSVDSSVGVCLVGALASFLLLLAVRQPHQAALIMLVACFVCLFFSFVRESSSHAETGALGATNTEGYTGFDRGSSEGTTERNGVSKGHLGNKRVDDGVVTWDHSQRRRYILTLLWWQLLMCLLLDALPVGLAVWRLIGLHEIAEGGVCQVADINNSLAAAMAESIHALRQTELDDSTQVWRLGLWVLSPSLQSFPLSETDVSDEISVRNGEAASLSDRFNVFASILRHEEPLFQAFSMCLALIPAIWLISWLLLQSIWESARRKELSSNANGEGFPGASGMPLAVKVQAMWQVVAALILPSLAFWLPDGMQMVMSVIVLMQCIVFSVERLRVPACPHKSVTGP
ncbi:PGAP1 family protein [Toxoplasma gondii TgCatPRC2]|uniref:PGAP1 family protein n=1 Tax=Toxoplasma gondii TgCatPRC2 TaxID=1130821 RepID=A0A151HAH3_TOXGO|nr:PGAP1 family protein [Toxoplasma gondii TgCatPRC2]